SMGFLRRIFSKDHTVEKKETVPELSNIVSDNYIEATSQNVSETIIFDPTPVNLTNRLFHKQKNTLLEGPETLYENEAWAPVSEYVGLFRKHRVNIEEQSTSSSDS
ncbi:MAG TPA: hypothetical protein VN456_10045, partial [Desulfosporosinus sp.]|nr:hypothetical protein [Desulfosporosinus sp.]